MAANAIIISISREARIVGKNFFPKNNTERRNRVPDLALVQLQYLATLNQAVGKSPFTQKQLETIRKSYRKDCQVYWGQRIGVVITVAVVAGIAYIGFALNNDSSAGEKAGIFTTGALISAVLAVLSFWATGFAPHSASNAFNDQQDALLDMQKNYENVAYRLITLYYSSRQNEALQLAQAIQAANLKREISQIISNPDRGQLIVAVLDEAVDHVLNNSVPNDVLLADLIQRRAREFAVPADVEDE